MKRNNLSRKWRNHIEKAFKHLSQNEHQARVLKEAEFYLSEAPKQEERLVNFVYIKGKKHILPGKIPASLYAPYTLLRSYNREEWEKRTGEDLSGTPIDEFQSQVMIAEKDYQDRLEQPQQYTDYIDGYTPVTKPLL